VFESRNAVRSTKRTVLSDEQRRNLDSDGFVKLDDFLSAREVAELGVLCDELIESGDGVVNLAAHVENADICPVARRPEVFRPQLKELSGWNKILTLGSSVLGPGSTLCSSAIFIKTPRIGGETFWHQDEAFYDAGYDYHELKVWAALDDIDDENSPLEYLPGSHLLGLLPHRTIDRDGICAVLADVDRDCRNVRRMLMKAGDVLIHRGYMAHHSPANRSDRMRRALVVNTMLPPTTRSEPRDMPWKHKQLGVRGSR
jgi:hypothetical protein